MFGTHDLVLFVVAGFVLNLTPGVDMLYIATASIGGGLRPGVAAALGICAGCCVHLLAAALGLSTLLATSAGAFAVVRLLGAGYLAWFGVTLLCRRPAASAGNAPADVSSWRAVFARGFLTNVLNPKVALFFIAFVPQFIDPASPHKSLAFLLLGAIFVGNSTLCCLLLAWGCTHARRLRVEPRVAAWINRGIGALFIALGVRLALARQG